MNDFLKHKLRELKKKYGYDISVHKDEIAKNNLSEEESLEVMLAYDFSEKLTTLLNDFYTQTQAASIEDFKTAYLISNILLETMFSVINQVVEDPKERAYITNKIIEKCNKRSIP